MRRTCPSLKTLTVTLATVAVLSGAVLAHTPTILFAQQLSSDVTTQAASGISLTATPLRIGDDNSVVVKPGEKTQVSVRVTNTSEIPLSVLSSAQDFIVEEDGGTPVPVTGTAEDSNRWSLASWLTLAPSQAVLQPRESSQISVLIEVPEDALPGGHYAMIAHQPSTNLNLTAADAPDAASGINQKVGTLLYVTVDGPINEEAYIRNFTIPEFSEFGPVEYKFTLDNRSDVHIHPQIGIKISNMFGQQVEVLQPTTQNVFPFTSREFTGEWSKIWGFGRYKADLTASYGTSGKVVMSTVFFWIFPVKLALATLIIILTAIATFVSVRRHLLHRKQDQTSRIQELEEKVKTLQDKSIEKYDE